MPDRVWCVSCKMSVSTGSELVLDSDIMSCFQAQSETLLEKQVEHATSTKDNDIQQYYRSRAANDIQIISDPRCKRCSANRLGIHAQQTVDIIVEVQQQCGRLSLGHVEVQQQCGRTHPLHVPVRHLTLTLQ